MVAQLVLMRELASSFAGNELVYGLSLAVWLLWVALGAHLAGRIAPRSLGAPFAGGLAACTVAVLAAIGFVRLARPLFGVPPGAEAGLVTTGVVAAAALAPVCTIAGALFTLGARGLSESGRPVAAAYGLESAGATAGGLAFSWVLVGRLSSPQIAFVLIAVALLSGAVLLGRRAGLLALALGIALALASVPLGRAVDATSLDWRWPDRVLATDSAYGRLVVTSSGEQRAFFQDGRLLFETQSTRPEEMAHLALLAHPSPRRVLMIGGGVDGTLREVLKHPVQRVVYVELDPAIIRAARECLPAAEAAVLDDPRVEVRLEDGRRAVQRGTERYDAILLSVPEPATGQLNRFYTLELFRAASQRLAPGGLLALSLPSAETYWSPAMRRRNAIVLRTLSGVFAYTSVTPGDTNYYLASASPIDLRADTLVTRLHDRGLVTHWVTADYLAYLLSKSREQQVRALLADDPGSELNTDLAPVCYACQLALWMSQVSSRPRLWPAPEPVAAVGLIVAALLGAVLLVRRRRAEAVVASVAVTGFGLMSVEIVLLLAFQSLYGYVYQELGLVIALFMVGMAVGALACSQPMPVGGRLAGWARSPLSMLVAAQAALAGAAAALPLLFGATWPPAAFGASAMAFGAMGGAVFALSSRLARGGAARVAGRLYATDLLGATIGALGTSVVLVPVLGIPGTCRLVGLLGLVAAVALAASPGPGSRAEGAAKEHA